MLQVGWLLSTAAIFVTSIPAYILAQSEIADWQQDRYVRCTFCMDYDDKQRLSMYGCAVAQPPTCTGNLCYMRQHKSNNYYLYTSGCLNITQREFDVVTQRASESTPARTITGNETQLCQVTATTNACICTNHHVCNNVSSGQPFTEHNTDLLRDIPFNEINHYRYFVPDDPVLPEVMQMNFQSSATGHGCSLSSVAVTVLLPICAFYMFL